MSKETYLEALSDWSRAGYPGNAPLCIDHSIPRVAVSANEAVAAINDGDPRPAAVSAWLWWGAHHSDLLRWHDSIRAVHQNGVTFTPAERIAAEAMYADEHAVFPAPGLPRTTAELATV